MDNELPAAPSPELPAVEPGDYYFEGGFMVFTAQYHLKRGYCCGSMCRHCPYGLAPNQGGVQRPEPGAAG